MDDEDPEFQRRQSEADRQVASYVSGQVERVERRDSIGAYEDEFNTGLNGDE